MLFNTVAYFRISNTQLSRWYVKNVYRKRAIAKRFISYFGQILGRQYMLWFVKLFVQKYTN